MLESEKEDDSDKMTGPSNANAASEAERLSEIRERIEFRISQMDPSRVNVGNMELMKTKLSDVQDWSEQYALGISRLISKYPDLEESFQLQYNADRTALLKSVNEHEDKICFKIYDLNMSCQQTIPSAALPGPGQSQQGVHQAPVQADYSTASATVARATVKYNTLLDLSLSTKQDMEEDGLYLDSASDEKISRLVQKISKYEKLKEKIKNSHTEYLEFTAVHKPDHNTHDPSKLSSAVQDTVTIIDTLIGELESQDEERNLATLLPRKMEKVKWPIFSGKPGESFFKFKEQFFKAAKQNMTTRADQLTKLRENLRDFPLTLVPESMESVQAAFSRLSDTYGDPQKLVNFELKKLEKVILFPNCDDGSYTVGTRAQAEWLLQLETVIDELMKMGNEDDVETDLKRSVFGPQTTTIILNKFPLVLKHQLISAAKANPTTEKLKTYRDKIKEWSKQALDLEKYEPEQQTIPKKIANPVQLLKDPQIFVFNPPKALPTCIVCVEMQKTEQLSPQLPHLSAHVTGCPVFIEMNMMTRSNMCSALNLCRSCLRVDAAGHEKLCIVLKLKKKNSPGKTKYEFTCKDKFCFRHMWLCSKHKTVNQESMDTKATDIEYIDIGYKLVHFLGCNRPSASAARRSSTPHHSSGADPAVAGTDQALAAGPEADTKVFKTAEKKLRKKSLRMDDSVEIVPIPEGEPMFMFQALKGKTKPVNAFYDSGCSNACLRTGVPGVQLQGQRLAKGPFNITGVNDVTIQAQDEWLVHLDRADGRKQLLRGVTLNTITGDSPIFSIEQATLELKADKPDNQLLQNCSVPKCVGGVVDILIGTLYNLIFPKPIHHLPNGLTIYMCTLASHDSSINATIGGPHTSFGILAEQVGGAAPLMAHFLAGLEKFKKWGPPSIQCNPATAEEMHLAKMLNMVEGDPVFEELVQAEQANEYIEDLIDSNEATWDREKLQQIISTSGDSVNLAVCECGRLCSVLNQKEGSCEEQGVGEVMFMDTEKISPLSRLKLLEDGGLNIEYRCVKCRDCSDCRNSEDSEKISLREEAEMYMIKESVKLDLANRRIICTLPVRGPERDFLSTNRDRALTVLDQQCRKYSKDEEVKEVALKAFKKLFDNGHASLIEDVEDETKHQFINKDPQYFIPWRLVFKESISTPCRAVLDASSRTKIRADGSGGRCLNDLVVKGKIVTINLVKMLLRFTAGRFAVTCDLQQFYNSCKLVPEQWNLQRFLYREDLDPENPVMEGVIKTLIYGVKSVSAQSEEAIKDLADHIRDKYPAVATLLEEGRYVDDEGESKAEKEECYTLIEQADETFALVNLKAKDWTVSGEAPSEKVSNDGASLDIGGMKWFSQLDSMETKIPPLHFGSKTRGRLSSKVKIFGSFGMSPSEMSKKLDEFVPKKLTRRMVASKRASIFDILGKLGVILISSSLLLRETVKATKGWDDAMMDCLRNKWLDQFMLWEQLRGIQFNRAIMPMDAVDCKMRLIVGGDAAKPAMIMGGWGGFKKADGSWSCQLMLGRALLTREDDTIPKSELTAYACGSNLAWLIRNSLKDWIDSYIVVGDSVIALCWISSEKKRLSLFHRNRVIQIRRGTDLDKMFHVASEHNPADVGTRPELVTLQDVQPDSKWSSGAQWMKYDLEDAVKAGILKPVSDLRLTTKEEQDDFRDGCVFDQVPEILTRGHVLNQRRISMIQERASFSQYLLVPTKFNFRRTVRIYSYVYSFVYKLISAVRRKKGLVPKKFYSEDAAIKFTVFLSISHDDFDAIEEPETAAEDSSLQTYIYFAEFTAIQSPPGYFALSQLETNAIAAGVTDKFINMALAYLYRKAGAEVTKFNSKKVVEKIAVEQDEILFSKTRILDGMNFAEMGDMGLSDLPVMGVKTHMPVIDRHSPMAYCIAQHVHWNIAHHKGIETCNRFSLQHCFIMQGMSLYRELAEECLWCAKKRKKTIEASMGPISDHQLSIAPPFWCAQTDLFGPVYCYVPGHERSTRRTTPAQVKTWILTTVCEVTKLVNAQVIEESDASGILDGMTRLGCEVGIPSILLADQGSNLVKAIREAEVSMLNLKLQMYQEKGIRFEVCSVGGHNEHGLVERVIRSLQDSMEESGLRNQRLTATGLQTLCKLVENDYNNLPMGFKYSRDQDNTEVLKMLTPNMMRHGRINSRALSGPLRLPNGASDMVDKVVKTYEAWYKVWSDSYIPKLLFRPKWFKEESDLKIGDLVYFRKSETEIGASWILGMIGDVERSRDGIIRKVTIKYRNANESRDRSTYRSVRNLCKIWSEDDWNMQDDLAELARRLKTLDGYEDVVHDVLYARLSVHHAAGHSAEADGCCCKSHCRLSHNGVGVLRSYQGLLSMNNLACDLDPQVPCFKAMLTECRDDDTTSQEPALDNLSDFLLNFNQS